MLLFIDTETTGLPLDFKISPRESLSNWPYIIQIAWIIADNDFNIIESRNFLRYPNEFTIPLDSIKIHGINNEYAKEHGISIYNIVGQFIMDLDGVNWIITHNADFDMNVLRAEFIRLNLDFNIEKFNIFCSMKSEDIINFCEIKHQYREVFKWPKLNELYLKLFNSNIDDAHDASSDVMATYLSIKKLVELNIISLEKTTF